MTTPPKLPPPSACHDGDTGPIEKVEPAKARVVKRGNKKHKRPVGGCLPVFDEKGSK